MSRPVPAFLLVPPLISAVAVVLLRGSQLVLAVMVFFWLGVVASIGTVFFLRRFPGWAVLSLACSITLLAIASRSVLSWAAWSLGGFAP